MEAPHSPFGVNPADLEAELEARRASHRAQVDLLKARLTEASARAAELRQRRSRLESERLRLEDEVLKALEAFDQADTEVEARLREVSQRHQRELADRSAALEAVKTERDNWIALERQIADGVMSAVQPFLQLNAFLRKQEGGDSA